MTREVRLLPHEKSQVYALRMLKKQSFKVEVNWQFRQEERIKLKKKNLYAVNEQAIMVLLQARAKMSVVDQTQLDSKTQIMLNAFDIVTYLALWSHSFFFTFFESVVQNTV